MSKIVIKIWKCRRHWNNKWSVILFNRSSRMRSAVARSCYARTRFTGSVLLQWYKTACKFYMALRCMMSFLLRSSKCLYVSNDYDKANWASYDVNVMLWWTNNERGLIKLSVTCSSSNHLSVVEHGLRFMLEFSEASRTSSQFMALK